MTAFDVRVEVAFTSGVSTAAASRAYTDVSPYVEAQNAFTITRGRQDDRSQVSPSTLTGLVLGNTDGRFTPELATGANYPNVKRGRPIRVRVRYPDAATQPGNFLTANQASMETDISDWSSPTALGALDVATLSSSTLHPQVGTKGGLATWPTTVLGSAALTPVSGLVIGRTYTASCYVYVPTGSPDVWMDATFVAAGTPTSTKNALTRISVTFVATQSTQFIGPRCASATAAQQCFWDAVMIDEGSAVAAFTTTAPPIYDRFMGYVNEWDVAWPDGGDTYATCTVAASSRTARMANAATLRSIIQEEYAVDAPLIQYTLGEAVGATQAGNSAVAPQNPLKIVQSGVGGSLTFGTGTGPGTDALPAVQFAPASFGNGQYLATALTAQLTGPFDHCIEIDAFFSTSTVSAQTIAALYADANNFLILSIGASGRLKADAWAIDSTGTLRQANATSTNIMADGLTHHGALRIVLSDATGQATLSVVIDGVVTTAAPIAWPTYVGNTFFPAYTSIVVGGPVLATGLGELFTGTLAHVGVYVQGATAAAMTDARLQAHANAGLNGFSGETAQARIARYASYLGVPTAEQSLETGLLLGVPHVDTTGQSALDLMQRVAVTSEDGLLFDGRDGTLTFQSRSHRYNVASALTLDASAQEIEADFAPKLDDQGILNDLTASRPGGIAVRSVNTASVADNGYARDSIELLTTSDGEVQSAADWKVSRLGVPRMKAPALSVDLLTFPTVAKIPTILTANLGTKITAAGLPAQAQAATFDAFIEGTKEVIGIAAWAISWNVSPVTFANVWQLDSPSYSQLDSTTVLAY